ncbi:MAG: SDR family NAD(P)-dependent oxidoreductase, partial [Rhodospirillaceae bacterium]|nr:SDR family NAD(P)-dependent oxidoreductase [Rhodospirillaceae bacterium]
MTDAADLYPSLRDRVVVVTGGGRGLGLEMALALVEAGARVTVTSAREAGELADTVAQAEAIAGPDRLIAVQADVRDYGDCLRVRERTLERFGAVHCLVNNAGRGMKLIQPDYVEERPKFWEAPLD